MGSLSFLLLYALTDFDILVQERGEKIWRLDERKNEKA